MEAGTEVMIAYLANERLAGYPDVPTVTEQYPEADLVMRGWVMIAAPAGIPEDVEAYLTDIFGKALQTDEYKEAIENLGMQYTVIYGDDLKQMIADDMAFYEATCADVELE